VKSSSSACGQAKAGLQGAGLLLLRLLRQQQVRLTWMAAMHLQVWTVL
jgi:hypothetical protein